MGKLTNTILLHDGHVEVICESSNYKHSVLLDFPSDIKSKIKISNTGYAYFASAKIQNHSVAHSILNHVSNKDTVVDHINGNSLDNRRVNLRVVSQHANSQNKSRFIRNNTGTIGIAYRKNGIYEYYRVSLTDRSKGLSENRQGRRVTKQFNITKLGKKEAFKQAQNYLSKMKVELGYLI